jgi:hypothetical protein
MPNPWPERRFQAAQPRAEGTGLDSATPDVAQSAMPSMALPFNARTAGQSPQRSLTGGASASGSNLHQLDGRDPSSEAGAEYFASERHYESLARRIVAALRVGNGRLVVVTGDPPAAPQVLSQALSKAADCHYVVIDVPCGPGLGRDEHERTVSRFVRPKPSGVAQVQPNCSAPASPLFVFHDIDRLSDRQIKDLGGGTLNGDQIGATGVLLAHRDFLARLEGPVLHFLKERLAAQFCVQELGDEEDIFFLHNQLLAQRDRVEARGFRRGMLIASASSAVISAASFGAFLLLYPTAEQLYDGSAAIGRSSSVSQPASILPPAVSGRPAPAVLQSQPATAFPPAPALALPPTKMENPPPTAPNALASPSATPRLTGTEVTALMRRGDAFFRAGDIVSARLFYERAADAGNGLAALQLGTTFDSVFLGRAGVRGIFADPGQALSWYQRARELGVTEAEGRAKAVETLGITKPDTRSR